MHKKIIIMIPILCFVITSCSSFSKIKTDNPEINLGEQLDSTLILVLPFSKKGEFLPSYAGSLFSNKLSDKLFLTDKYFVVDNNALGDILHQLSIKNLTRLTQKEILSIGSFANADYIISGTIFQYTDSELIGLEAERKINVSGKILNIHTETTSGVINIFSRYKSANIIDVFESITKKIVEGIEDNDS